MLHKQQTFPPAVALCSMWSLLRASGWQQSFSKMLLIVMANETNMMNYALTLKTCLKWHKHSFHWSKQWCQDPLRELFSHSVLSDSLRPHGLQHTRLPCLHYLLESAQTNVHWVDDAIQPSLSSPSPPTFNLSQHQGLLQWVDSLHQVAKVLQLQF